MRKLGGSELARMYELMSTDHEWSCKLRSDQETVTTEYPLYGSRIIFKLYWDIAPLACENFATLCANGGNSLDIGDSSKKIKPAPVGESGKELTYRNSTIHRVVKGFIFQGGDFVFGNGSGGESIYSGKKFKDERAGIGLKHDRAGILSMGNSGKNSNTSQFFVTFDEAPQCDGKHVVFGEVVSGMEVITAVESLAASGGGPSAPIKITDCGAYTPFLTPGAGFWYDRPDSQSYSGKTPEFMVRPRVGILAPSKEAAQRFSNALGEHASTTLLVAVDGAEGGGNSVIRSLLESLGKFSLDVIVVAPACAKFLDFMDVPASWNGAAKKSNGAFSVPKKENVFIEAKPVDVIAAIMSKSWLGAMSTNGWLLSASFVYCNWSDLGRAISAISLNI